MNAKQTTPLSNCERFAIKAKHSIAAHVVLLLLPSGPTAIGRFVISVLVWVSVNGMATARSLPHIGNEVVERIQPALANGDATSTVVFVKRILRIKASHLDGVPDFVYWRLALAVGSNTLSAEASATYRMAVMKVFGENYFLNPTLASTEPFSLLFPGGRLGNYSKSSEDLSGQIVKTTAADACNNLFLQATAALSFAATKRLCANFFTCPAGTLTEPVYFLLVESASASKTNDRQSPKRFPGEVLEVFSGRNRLNRSHDAYSPGKSSLWSEPAGDINVRSARFILNEMTAACNTHMCNRLDTPSK